MFRPSGSSNLGNKRKREVLPQDARLSRHTAENAHQSTKDTDDNSPPSPYLRKAGKSRAHAKEDVFLDLSAVPRKTRSSIVSSSRFTSSRSHDCFAVEVSQQLSPTSAHASLNGSSSPNHPHTLGKRLKSVATKFHVSKASRISYLMPDSSNISDQEVEVAEALFVLATSTPSSRGVLESMSEAKCDRTIIACSSATSSAFITGPSISVPNPASIHNPGSMDDISGISPVAEAPKRKGPRVGVQEEEGRVSRFVGVVASATALSSGSPCGLIHSFLDETAEPESVLKRGHSRASPDETLEEKVDIVASQQLQIKDMKINCIANEDKEHEATNVGKSDTHSDAKMDERSYEPYFVRSSSAVTNDTLDVLYEKQGLTNPDLSSSSDMPDTDGGEISELQTNLTTTTTNCKLEMLKSNGKERCNEGDAVTGLDNRCLESKEKAGGRKRDSNQELTHQRCDRGQKVHRTLEPFQEKEIKKENHPVLITQNNATGNPTCVSSSSSTVASPGTSVSLAGWMGGFPQWGAAPWAACASFERQGSKATHPVVQLSHARVLPPVPKMKSCATHVYVAHLIHREQHVSRLSLWSAAVGVSRKSQIHQSGLSHGYTISPSSLPGMTGSGSMNGNTSAPKYPAGAGASADSGNIMAAHAQYLQAMIQQNGFASFPFPFNGPPDQVPHLFGGSFVPPYVMLPVAHLQPLTQQGANVLPVQKQQQGNNTSLSDGSQLVAPPLMQQGRVDPQSPSQPQNHMEISAGQSIEKESKVGRGKFLMAERELQRSLCGLSPTTPSLNARSSPPMRTHSGRPKLSSHDLAVASASGKQPDKSQQQLQYQVRTPASSSSPGQKQESNSSITFCGLGHQLKKIDHSFSQGNPNLAMMGNSRCPVGPGPLGLGSVASMVATECNGVLPGSHEEGHSQQYHKTIRKAAPVSENVHTVKGRDCSKTKRVCVKQAGTHFNLPKVNVEADSSSFHGSASSVNGPSSSQSNDMRLTVSSTSFPGTASCRSASCAVAGQGLPLPTDSPKQDLGGEKGVDASTVPTGVINMGSDYIERVSPENMENLSGMVHPPSSQASKLCHASIANVTLPGPAPLKSQAQHASGSIPGAPSAPPQMLSSVSRSSETLSMLSSSLSFSKAASNSSPSHAEGVTSSIRSDFSAKKQSFTITSPTPTSPGQHVLVTQLKTQAAAFVPQFSSQQLSIPAQEQKIKNQALTPQGQYKHTSLQQSRIYLQQQQAGPSPQSPLPLSGAHLRHDSQSFKEQQAQPMSSSATLIANGALPRSTNSVSSTSVVLGQGDSPQNISLQELKSDHNKPSPDGLTHQKDLSSARYFMSSLPSEVSFEATMASSN